MGIFARRKREKHYTTMSIEELRMLDNDELRDAVSARMMKELEDIVREKAVGIQNRYTCDDPGAVSALCSEENGIIL